MREQADIADKKKHDRMDKKANFFIKQAGKMVYPWTAQELWANKNFKKAVKSRSEATVRTFLNLVEKLIVERGY